MALTRLEWRRSPKAGHLWDLPRIGLRELSLLVELEAVWQRIDGQVTRTASSVVKGCPSKRTLRLGVRLTLYRLKSDSGHTLLAPP